MSNIDKEKNQQEKKSSFIPLPGQIPTFDYLSDPGGKKAQEKLETDHKNFDAAKNSLRENAENNRVIAPKGPDKPYRDATFVTEEHNSKHGTNFKPEDQTKISSKKFGNIEVHATQDAKSGTIYGDKPIDTSQRAIVDTFKETGRLITNPQNNSKAKDQIIANESGKTPSENSNNKFMKSSGEGNKNATDRPQDQADTIDKNSKFFSTANNTTANNIDSKFYKPEGSKEEGEGKGGGGGKSSGNMGAGTAAGPTAGSGNKASEFYNPDYKQEPPPPKPEGPENTPPKPKGPER